MKTFGFAVISLILGWVDDVLAQPKICGAEELSSKELAEDAATMKELKQSLGEETVKAMADGVVNVRTHVFVVYKSNGVGNLSQEAVDLQMQVMIDAFQGVVSGQPSSYDTCAGFSYGSTTTTPFRFDVKPYIYVQNDQAFDMDSSYSENWRAAERIGDCSDLNIFIGDTNYLGFAWFPQWCSSDQSKDAVVINYSSLPDNSGGAYAEGDTLVHEVGHWLGLYHTFQGGCSGGDYVADTPAEASPAHGCPMNRDTCSSDGFDPIHNYMDYTYDCCMYKFTPDQTERMLLQVKAYRVLEVEELTPTKSPVPSIADSVSPSITPTLSFVPSIADSKSPSITPTLSYLPSKGYEGFCLNIDEIEFTLELMTDRYAYEISWTLTDSSGEEKGSGNNYYMNEHLHTEELCIPRGDTYTFTILDSFGDGICCLYGTGYFKGYVRNNQVFSGGEYTFSATETFTVDALASSSPSIDEPDIPTASPTDCQNSDFFITLNTDQYGEETSWALYNETSDIVAMGYQYNDTLTYTHSLCVDGCYNFTIMDSHGDGMCCDDGIGGYTLELDGELIMEGGDFSVSESATFCTFAESEAPSSLPSFLPSSLPSFLPTPIASDEPSNTWVQISYDDFATGWGNYKSGGKDAKWFSREHRNKSRGIGSLVIQDNSKRVSSFCSKDWVDVSAYSKVLVEFDYIVHRFKNGEDFFFEYKTDRKWSKLATYEFPNTFTKLKNWYKGYELLDTSSMTQIKIRFRCDASSNRDKVFIDNIYVHGMV